MLRVLSLNVWNDSGPWDRRRELIRSWVRRLEPDVIGLQEILRSPSWNQAVDLLDGFGYRIDYARANEFWKPSAPDFGNAVASRWPIVDREETTLPDNGDGETRCALSVTLDAPFGPLCFTCTHLNWKFHHGFVRERQVVALMDFVLKRRPRDGFPPVVVGDFNAEPDSAEIRYVTGKQSMGGRSVYMNDSWRVAGSGGDGTTWSNRNPYARLAQEPDRRIDYIFGGFPRADGTGKIERCRVVCDADDDGVWPSDHFGVYAELRATPRPAVP